MHLFAPANLLNCANIASTNRSSGVIGFPTFRRSIGSTRVKIGMSWPWPAAAHTPGPTRAAPKSALCTHFAPLRSVWLSVSLGADRMGREVPTLLRQAASPMRSAMRSRPLDDPRCRRRWPPAAYRVATLKACSTSQAVATLLAFAWSTHQNFSVRRAMGHILDLVRLRTEPCWRHNQFRRR